MYYAQIDGNDICYAVTQTAGQINQANMIEIDGIDESLLLKKYVDGQWVDVIAE